ncbi:proline-rich protein 2-like [Pteropus alecto]|uniref:proline-rich protein 2-like n=1 Tax=Pteropus alecto TaxID=9402 RepID=UPI000D53BC6D|nr:proline-rich protein 2-like [Pteropus alecto]
MWWREVLMDMAEPPRSRAGRDQKDRFGQPSPLTQTRCRSRAVSRLVQGHRKRQSCVSSPVTQTTPLARCPLGVRARPSRRGSITRKGRNKVSLTLSLQTRPSTTGSHENREAGSANVTVQTSRETQHKEEETARTHSRGSRRDSCGGAPANPPSRPKRTKSPDVQPLPTAVVRTLPPQPVSSSQREVPGGTVTQTHLLQEASGSYTEGPEPALLLGWTQMGLVSPAYREGRAPHASVSPQPQPMLGPHGAGRTAPAQVQVCERTGGLTGPRCSDPLGPPLLPAPPPPSAEPVPRAAPLSVATRGRAGALRREAQPAGGEPPRPCPPQRPPPRRGPRQAAGGLAGSCSQAVVAPMGIEDKPGP